MKKLWNAIVKFIKYLFTEDSTPAVTPAPAIPTVPAFDTTNVPVNLELLRKPENVADLPVTWMAGWKSAAEGSAVIYDENGFHQGKILNIKIDVLTLTSKLGVLAYGLHPIGNYDQPVFFTGSGTGPGGAVLVMVTVHPRTGELLFASIDETRPMSFMMVNGVKTPMVMRTPPGGFVDPKEEADKAAQREAFEECGILTGESTYIGSIVPDRAFFAAEFFSDGQPARWAVAVYGLSVPNTRLIENADGSFSFPKLAATPKGMEKPLKASFRTFEESVDTPDGIAIAAFTKTYLYFLKSLK